MGSRMTEPIEDIQAAIALAETLGHGPSLAHALLFASITTSPVVMRSPLTLLRSVLVTVAEENRLALYRAVGGVVRGWAVAHQGHVEDGLTELSRSLATYDADKPKSFSGSCRSAFAEVYLIAG